MTETRRDVIGVKPSSERAFVDQAPADRTVIPIRLHSAAWGNLRDNRVSLHGYGRAGTGP